MEQEVQYNLKKFLPHPALAGHIDSYWIIEAPAPPTVETYATMFPLGYPMIEFNMSDGWVKRSEDSETNELISSHITSFTNKPFFLRPSGKVKSAGARLHPLALRSLLGDDVDKNTIFDPHLVFGKAFKEAEEKVALANSWNETKEYLDAFFLDVFGDSQIATDYRVTEMMRRIISEGGSTNLWQSTKELGLSQKRIEQLFHDHVGMSPKAYAGIVRFQRVLALYQPEKSLTQLAHESGYYDQSHFIRHFKKITNQTPKNFFRNECIYTCKITNLYNFSNAD